MNPDLLAYIEARRHHGASDKQIKADIVASGWPAHLAAEHLRAAEKVRIPEPPVVSRADGKQVEYGTFGVEYVIMLVSLWIAAVALGSALYYIVSHSSYIYGDGKLFSAGAAAALIVSLPVYTFLFFRLRKQELKTPQLRQSVLRKWSIYAVLIITFLTAITQIGWSLFMLMGGGIYDYTESGKAHNPVADIWHILITLLIAVPIFAFYFRDLRPKRKRI